MIMHNYYKASSLIIVVLLSYIQVQGHIYDYVNKGENIELNKIEEALYKMICFPSTNTAKSFLKSIPVDNYGNIRDKKTAIKGMRIGKVWGDYIGREMLGRNLIIIEAAFRAICMGDEKSEHFFRSSLSDLIRVDPIIYLKYLQQYRSAPYFKMAGYPVDGIPDDYRDFPILQWYEMQMRVDALKRVEVEELKRLRDECLNILKRRIAAIKAPIPSEKLYPEEDDADVTGIANTDLLNVGWWVVDDFFMLPSPRRAKALCSVIPLKNENIPDALSMFTIENVIMWEGYAVLAHEAMCGNQFAAEAIFRLINRYNSGIYAEKLAVTLTSIIWINPDLFLNELYKYRRYYDDSDLYSLLQSMPLIYNTKRARAYLYNMRKQALESVTDTRLRKLRDELLNIIEEAIIKNGK